MSSCTSGIISTRAELKEYALRANGHPVLEVNIADEQVEDRCVGPPLLTLVLSDDRFCCHCHNTSSLVKVAIVAPVSPSFIGSQPFCGAAQ